MNVIGGYFELAERERGEFPHAGGVLLNTGRNGLELILRTIGPICKVYLPLYTCEAVMEPIAKLGIPYQFYRINERLEIAEELSLQEGEYLIANNYFGIKDAYMRELAAKYKDRLIADCTQAFLSKPMPGIMSFYSCRKFVGVADGGVAYPRKNVELPYQIFDGEDPTGDHDSHLYTRKQYGAEAGFKEFQENSCKLDNQPIRTMSHKTFDILEHIDYDKVAAKRVENFRILNDALGKKNQLNLSEGNIPMVYPYWVPNGSNLRAKLISNKIFCAQYWPNVYQWSRKGELEYDVAENLIAIPCDQRYGKENLKIIISKINE